MQKICMHLTDEHIKKIDEWITKCYREYFEENPTARGKERGVPAQGAIGGGITYCITPTSIGDIWTVKMELGYNFKRSLYIDSDC